MGLRRVGLGVTLAAGLMMVPQLAFGVVSGKVVIMDQGQPVPGATITLVDQEGNKVAEEKSDDRGVVAFMLPDKSKGSTLTAVVRRGTRRWKRPVTVADGFNVPIDLDKIAAAFGWPKILVDVHGGVAHGSQEAGTTGTFAPGVIARGSSDINSDTGTLGGDVQFVHTFPWYPGFDLVALVGATWYPGGDNLGRHYDFHPTLGDDTVAWINRNWSFDCGVGARIPLFDGCGPGEARCFDVTLIGGVSVVNTEYGMRTDETGGGGRIERFEDSVTQVAPFARGTFGFPICPNCPLPVGGKVGAEMRLFPGHRVDGISSLGFPYNSRFDRGWDVNFFGGFYVALPDF